MVSWSLYTHLYGGHCNDIFLNRYIKLMKMSMFNPALPRPPPKGSKNDSFPYSEEKLGEPKSAFFSVPNKLQ